MGSANYLAFDLGAESGRVVAAQFHHGVLQVETVHRFPNEPVHYGGSLHWDIARLWLEMQRGLEKTEHVRLEGIGIDTWAIDYALLGEGDELLENPWHYRDARTQGAMEELFRLVSPEQIYQTTGIQFMPINTLYQLFRSRQTSPALFAAAKHFLTIPDLLNFWCTGKAVCEFTNASTTQLLNIRTHQWAAELWEALELPPTLPCPVVEPGTILGPLQHQCCQSGTPVIAPATHDTGSAVASVSAGGNTAFLSSGTWSLLGTELSAPVITPQALALNFTNEGGVCGTTRLLKNVMGLWLLQGCRRAWAAEKKFYEYPELIAAVEEEATPFRHLIDPDDRTFLRTSDMVKAIDEFCLKTDQPVPTHPGAYTRAVLESLAFKYRVVIENLERVSGQPIEQIRVIGGGSQNKLLNQFTADATGRRVLAGPVEATALGNIAMQMLATGAVSSLTEARAVIDRSFPTEIFEPFEHHRWNQRFAHFQQYCEYTYA